MRNFARKGIFKIVIILLLLAVIVFSGYKLWNINKNYADEAKLHGELLEYKPAEPSESADTSPEQPEGIVNQEVVDLQAQYPDAVGWLTVPGTKIDYPFVWYEDNDYYLRRDINGDYAVAGTVFMDYRCNKDFTSQNTIIYGHHMKNGSMFQSLKNFNNQSFFDAHTTGTIYLPHDTLTLEIFAYMVVDPATEKEIYRTGLSDTYFNYVRQNARFYREMNLTDSDKIVTLSTCAYEFDDARMVVLAKIV